MKIYDEYANVLRGMYSVRFNGGSSTQAQSAPQETPPPFVNTLEAASALTKVGNARQKRRRRGLN
jgi:hypothetical protein